MFSDKALVPHRFRHLVAPFDAEPITLERFRHLIGYPNWSIVCDAATAARRYDLGLDFAMQLFRAAWHFEAQLSAHEFERALHITSIHILDMLDKADRWEDYIDWFVFLRDYSTVYLRERTAWLARNTPLEDYLIRYDGDYAILRYMYHYHPRYSVIRRKLARKRAGRSTAHLEHHSFHELSPDQVHDRLAHVAGFWRFKKAADARWDAYWGRNANT